MDHLISTDKSEDMDIVNSWLNWTMTLSQLFNHHDNEQLTAIRKHINGDFDASQLLKGLDTVQKPFSADHWQFSSPAAMIGVAIFIAVVSIVVLKKCCAQSPTTAQIPMATAPPVIPQQHQPQPQPTLVPTAPVYAQHQNPTFLFSKLTALCLSTLKQGEGTLSSSQFFSELSILICTFPFIFIPFHFVSDSPHLTPHTLVHT
jgi:hypothetical protein